MAVTNDVFLRTGEPSKNDVRLWPLPRPGELASAGFMAVNALWAQRSFVQAHYRFRTDSLAVDATPTWGANEDTTFNPASANFRLRFSISNSNFLPGIASGYEIYVSRNGGAYQPITTSSQYVRSVDASVSPEGAAITIPRLTAAL